MKGVVHQRIEADPLVYCTALALAFFVASLVRFEVPQHYLFDEGFYVPAATELLSGNAVTNREHPMLGKTMLAASIALFGNGPVGWRLPSLILMPAALAVTMRAFWWFTRNSQATILFGILLATSCLLNVLGRIGLLDAPAFFFASVAAYFFARDRDEPDFCRIVGCGVAIGLSLACKWTIAPLLPVIGLVWLAQRGLTVRAIFQGGLWLGTVPFVVYFLTFAPGFYVDTNPLRLEQLLPLQVDMARAVSGYEGPSAYPAEWWQWLLNRGPYWALASEIGGAWRFVVIAGNPVSTLLIIPAVLYAAWLVVSRREKVLVWAVLLYVVPVGLAAVGDRLMFFHHYALPMVAGFGLLALFLSRLPTATAWPTVAATLIAFAMMFPVLSAAPMSSRDAAFPYIAMFGRSFVDWGEWSKVNRANPRPNWARLQRCLERPGSCKSPIGQTRKHFPP